jgi:hypothetical protein
MEMANCVTGVHLALNDVMAAVASGRSFTDGSGPWTLKHLQTADAMFAGRWRMVDVPADALRQAVLGAHAGEPCRGDSMELVPAGGASVAATASRLRAARVDYEGHNPSCWGRMQQAAGEPFSLIVLAMRPMIELGHGAGAAGRFFVVDGLHRLVAWELAGRLAQGGSIRACICG